MKAFLMYRDQDFDLGRELPTNEGALTQDLGLNTLFEAMALGDEFLFDVVKKALLSSLTDPEEITYRQQALADCLEEPEIIRDIYRIAVEAIQGEKNIFLGLLKDSPDAILNRSLQVLQLFFDLLKRLRQIADEHAARFRSEAFTRFFAMLEKELDDKYLQTVEHHLKELQFHGGVQISARLGRGNKGANYVLRTPKQQSLMERLPFGNRSGYSFTIPDRDMSGLRAVDELRGRGLNPIANALAQSTDHILSFFTMLRSELAFYIGCLNLHSRLAEKDEPTCFPVPLVSGRDELSAQGLYDVSLSLNLEERVVGNDLGTDGKRLVMITGANQGGKSTFLRSVGLAQLMMQGGMFVPAESFRASVCNGIFTHYKREEDATMTSGKLDEELSRMSDIADKITPNSILLCNESFASTNEREGSEIARQVVCALIEANVKIFFVTHLFDLAYGFYHERLDTALFLRAERQPDGRRTFRLVEGEPLPTSYGEDSYRRIFSVSSEDAPTTSDVRR